MSKVLERFLRYVAVDTCSDPHSATFPSTMKQKNLGELLVAELLELGVKDARMDEYGYVYGKIPANRPGLKKVGFLAHMDTSPDLTGENVKPVLVRNYDGGDIPLNPGRHVVMRPSEFEHLLNYTGQDLVVTDGTTLLGADDKAGIAEIMTMAETLLSDPSIPHGDVKICFTPDEEVGNGTQYFDVEGFGADFAYTVDGGEAGEICFENFNAASAFVTVNGSNVHPGSAKGKMKNAILIAMEFQSMLPPFENPACTEGYEGFEHLNAIEGTVEQTKLEYIIRDHDLLKLGQKKERFEKIAAYLNERYGDGTIELSLKDSYLNMKETILPHYEIVEAADEATRACGLTPIHRPIRGGTDGARLSFMGLPCPNLGTGGHNSHGKYDYVPVQSLEKVTEILIQLVRILAEK